MRGRKEDKTKETQENSPLLISLSRFLSPLLFLLLSLSLSCLRLESKTNKKR